jgi:hypothetical protein
MRPTIREVIGQLQAEGLVTAPDEAQIAATLDGQTLRPTEVHQPWFVRLLMGMGAWAASACFIGFLTLIHVIDSRGSSLVCGVLLAGAATLLRRASRHDVAVQLSLSLCLAGRALVYGGVDSDSKLSVWVVALLLEGAMVLVYPDMVNRFISTGGMWLALMGLLDALGAPSWVIGLATAGLGAAVAAAWEHQGTLAAGRWSQHHAPVASALAVSLLGTLLVLSGSGHREELSGGVIAAAVGLTGVFAAFLWRVLQEHRVPRAGLWVALSLCLGALTWSTPALIASLLLLGLGFHRRQPLLLGLAAGALVASGVLFY